MDEVEQVRRKFSSPAEIEVYRALHGEGMPPELLPLVRRFVDPADLALGMGCGTGRELWGLRREGYRRLVGLDFSWPMLRAARGLAPDEAAGRRLVQMDAARPGFRPGSFRGIMLFDQLLSFVPGAGRRRAMLSALRLLVPSGGGLVLSYLRRREDWKYRLYFAATVPAFAVGHALGWSSLEPGDRIASVTQGVATPGRMRFHYFHGDEVARALAETGWGDIQEGGGGPTIAFLGARAV